MARNYVNLDRDRKVDSEADADVSNEREPDSISESSEAYSDVESEVNEEEVKVKKAADFEIIDCKGLSEVPLYVDH